MADTMNQHPESEIEENSMVVFCRAKKTLADAKERLANAEKVVEDAEKSVEGAKKVAEDAKMKVRDASFDVSDAESDLELCRVGALNSMAKDMLDFVKNERMETNLGYDFDNLYEDNSYHDALILEGNQVNVAFSNAFEKEDEGEYLGILEERVDFTEESCGHETVKMTIYIPRDRVAHLIKKNFG